ncbi:MAG: hypothetical protein FWE25_09920 [Lachnospiraceae bacterium]|nr:hypothetical protein [Lachnospiraceae bacterium]
MNRVPELLEYLKEDMEHAVAAWKESISRAETADLVPLFVDAKNSMQSKQKSLIVTYLRSSYITQSNQFGLTSYAGEVFVGEIAFWQRIGLAFLFDDVAATMEQFTQKLQLFFIRVFSYEVEEVRRYYMELLYQNSVCFFEIVLQNVEKAEVLIPVYFGEEMGKLVQIGEI